MMIYPTGRLYYVMWRFVSVYFGSAFAFGGGTGLCVCFMLTGEYKRYVCCPTDPAVRGLAGDGERAGRLGGRESTKVDHILFRDNDIIQLYSLCAVPHEACANFSAKSRGGVCFSFFFLAGWCLISRAHIDDDRAFAI